MEERYIRLDWPESQEWMDQKYYDEGVEFSQSCGMTVFVPEEKYSNNKKLNEVLNEIRYDLLNLHDTEAESLSEIAHYRSEFPEEVDFNLVQFGNLLIYYVDIRAMYERHGYKSIARMTDTQVWETYRRQVGYVARTL